jgi:hypothetical protein
VPQPAERNLAAHESILMDVAIDQAKSWAWGATDSALKSKGFVPLAVLHVQTQA